MHFDHPIALLLLLLALLLLFTRQHQARTSIPVGNLYLWRDASRQDAPALARRLRRHWLLLLQLAALAAMAIAAAAPTIASRGMSAAIILDTSLSMQALQGGASRLALAQAAAGTVVEQLPARARVRLIAAGPQPRVVGEFAASDRTLLDAIESVASTDATADIATAIQLARGGERPAGTIHVFSDGVAAATAAQHPDVRFTAVGTPVDNAAISGLTARPVSDGGSGIDVLATVANHSGTALQATLTLSRNDTELARRNVDVGPHLHSAYSFRLEDVEGVLAARLIHADALDADNVRRLAVRRPRAVRVLLQGAIGGFLQRALAAHPHVRLLNDPAAPHDVLVCGGCAEIPAGNAGVLLIPPRSPAPSPPADLVKTSIDHPVAAGLELDGVFAIPAGPADLSAGAVAKAEAGHYSGAVIARAGNAPAIVAYTTGARRVVEIHVDPDGGQLPLTAAFPVLVWNAVAWLAGEDLPGAIEAGSPIELPLRATAAPTVVAPDGSRRDTVPNGGRVSVVETSAAGVYVIRDGTGERPVAVNAAAGDESNLTRPPEQTPAPEATTATMSGAYDITAPLVVVAVALLGLEWRHRQRTQRAV